MVTVRDVPADKLIERLAEHLKKHVPAVKPPPWALFVKTGPHKERVPDNPDWWYYRAASILRKLYLAKEPIGIETFRVIYGGLKRRGSAPPHFRRCGGSHIRKILQQLEKAGLVAKTPKGRVITPQGRALLDRLAWEIFQELVRKMPELSKYGPPSLRQSIVKSSSQ
ncbi:MAG TPA: 30S ribosomal protein S19e [Ignisphaera aggregans]|uniref:Small ribosomal subunit protein eS19 n=1 Tax=Ignisphaera aggregans TaxID=334771 RepID=A0A833DV52_9CREN|nr:30S ribosomal protein S19e [Ignisphaera aggregans]